MSLPNQHKLLAGVFAAALTVTLALTSPATADNARHHDSGHYGHHRSHEHHGHHGYHKGHHGLEPRTHFRMQPDGSSGRGARGARIPNIDSVKDTIATYYGDTGEGTANMDSSPYISELHRIQSHQRRYLRWAYHRAIRRGEKPALVFDADDTTLMTYDMEVQAMHFNFDPDLQDVWVQDERFPATPGMVDFVNDAEDMGYAVFGLTGRNADQEEATLGNLDNVGYEPFNADNFFTEWVDPADRPDYIECAEADCSTVEYKAGTRRHIEQDLGYDIVLNVGDQWSDLKGGYADRTLKLPNPTYYLPSPNLPGKHEPWLSPRTHFTMEPDGSSGMTEGGEGIPNIDSVKSTIRAYYNATDGLADKQSSAYKSEVGRLADRWTPRLERTCRRLDRRGQDPAIVLDADDTTLWTYDMEDAAMGFHFDPELQDVWVQNGLFPATPGMVDLVNTVDDAGCTIVGLTGRNATQEKATIANLEDVGYTGFTAENYYTEWVDEGDRPGYIDCAEGECTRVEYKSQTRAHVEDQGYRIIANFGDQFSDLLGGHANRAIKLPNPTYYLP